MPLLRKIGLLIGLCGTCVAGASTPTLQELVQKLPDRKFTLGLILAGAMGKSDAFRAIIAEKHRVPFGYLQARGVIDTEFFLRGERLIDENEQLSPFAAQNIKTTTYTVGARSYFFTGTQLSAELATSSTEFQNLSPTTGAPFTTATEQTTGTLSLTQNLWRDFFGYATRKNLDAGDLQTEAAIAGLQGSIEDWALQLTEVYYDAWLTQARVRAAMEGLARRQRLLKITKIKVRRGTAERPDLIQANNALVNSELALREARQHLDEIWRRLIITLKADRRWLQLDPEPVPMELDEPTLAAIQDCGPAGKLNPHPKETATTKQLTLAAQASSLRESAARNQAMPQAQLFGTLTSNGVDPERSPTFSETFAVDHPAWAFGVSLTVPLFNYAAKAQATAARADRERDEALAADALGSLELDWVNSCTDLHRLSESIDKLSKNYTAQNKRISLEERRFRLGRVPQLNVIQAGDDATQAELDLRQAEVDTRLAAWKIKQLKSSIKNTLEGFVSRYE